MTVASYLGIDVSKATLDVATTECSIGSYPNTPAGFEELVAALADVAVELVVIESTGIYSRPVADHLATLFPVAVVQPGRARRYAQSQGVHAKTDAIDAKMLARFGAASPDLRRYQPTSETMCRFRALVDRRDQVVEDRKREKTRLEACREPAIVTMIKRHIAVLDRAILRLEQDIRKAVESDAAMSGKRKALESHVGVGLVTATCLMAHLPELGTVNRQAIAALAGLAPFNQESGAWRGQRTIYGGRQRVRTALYMAALAAIRSDDQFKAHYRQLRNRGKAAKVALVACARKLLVKINATFPQQEAETVA